MTTPAAEAVSRRLGAAVRGLSGAWYGRHMASAERAIRARLPLVDLVLEVRDARAPASSSFEPLLRRRGPLEPDRRAVVLLNKADLADPSETEGWVAYIKKQRRCSCVAVNSHSRESIKEVLKVVQARMREIKHGDSNCTGTALLVGIPNVGKSAIVNAIHQIGRIAAAEKGKLKHAIVSSHPGETRDIRGYKVSSYALGRMTRSAAFPDHLVIVALLQVGIYAAVLSASTKSSIYHLMDNKTEECFFI
uniref:G domain-containing protein n=1 Tax=Zea mays TaxID=4577 RepID=B4FHQ8_MAIZE|nr:unknown [Zea mays]